MLILLLNLIFRLVNVQDLILFTVRYDLQLCNIDYLHGVIELLSVVNIAISNINMRSLNSSVAGMN